MLLIWSLWFQLVYWNYWRNLVYSHFLIDLVSYVLKTTHPVTPKPFLGSRSFTLNKRRVCLIIFARRSCNESSLKGIIAIHFDFRGCTWSLLTFVTTRRILVIILLIINLRLIENCARLIFIQINFIILLLIRKF